MRRDGYYAGLMDFTGAGLVHCPVDEGCDFASGLGGFGRHQVIADVGRNAAGKRVYQQVGFDEIAQNRCAADDKTLAGNCCLKRLVVVGEAKVISWFDMIRAWRFIELFGSLSIVEMPRDRLKGA